MKVYIPSYLGDVAIESDGPNNSKLTFSELTETERKAVLQFLKHYGQSHVIGDGVNRIPEPIDKAQKRFVKAFKLGRPTINAIRIKGGKVEIVESFPEHADVGVTVEKPNRGCPMPVWERAEARGTSVLKEFLSDDQWADFEKHKAFLARGNYSGRAYRLTSRWSPWCEKFGVLYSTYDGRSICASQANLPPAEELLALKIVIECDERNFVGIWATNG